MAKRGKSTRKRKSGQPLNIAIRGSSPRTSPSGAAGLAQFRSQVRELQRKHLLSPKYQAKTVKPTKYLEAQIRKYKPVLTGEAEAVLVRPKTYHTKEERAKIKQLLKQYTLAPDIKRKGQTLIVPIAHNEKIELHPEGIMRIRTTPYGDVVHMETIFTSINIQQFLDAVNDGTLDPDPPEGFLWSFRYFGNSPRVGDIFPNLRIMQKRLAEYKNLDYQPPGDDPEYQEPNFRLILVEASPEDIERAKKINWAKENFKARQRSKSKYMPDRSARRRRLYKKFYPGVLEERHRKEEHERRTRILEDPVKAEAYRTRDRLRKEAARARKRGIGIWITASGEAIE